MDDKNGEEEGESDTDIEAWFSNSYDGEVRNMDDREVEKMKEFARIEKRQTEEGVTRRP